MRNPPVAVCTKCGAYTYRAEAINNQCNVRINGKRCTGTFRSAIGPNDWETCEECSGSGCEFCQKSGFIFVRK